MSSTGPRQHTQRNASQSLSRPLSPATNRSVDGRPSLDMDSEQGSVPVPNGRSFTPDLGQDSGVESLQRQLQQEREEKENLATQYHNLLAKLTTMRTSLGNKLKQDAVRAH